MQKFFSLFFVFFIFIAVSSCDYIKALRFKSTFGSAIDVEKDPIFRESGHPSFIPPVFNETSRLFYLCKVWGFAKYYHEGLISKVVNVDSILLNAIPQVIQARDKIEFCSIISRVIASINLTPLKGLNPYPDIKDYCLIDNSWMNDTININRDIKQQLEKMFLSHAGFTSNFAYNRSNIGTIRLRNENKYANYKEDKIRLLGLFRFWNVIHFFYPSKNHMDESWDKALYESIPKFRNTHSEKAYHVEIYRLTNRLKDTHASFPPSIDAVVFGPYRPNFRMMKIQDTFIISKIRVPENNRDLFQRGDMVVRIDNEEVHKIYDSLQAFIGGGNYWSKQRFVCNAVLSRQDSTTAFTILRGKDTLTIHSKNKKAWNLHQQKRREKEKLYRWLSDSIAYFDLASVSDENFEKNYNQIKHAKTIILDLRCYPSTGLTADLADNFVPPNSIFAFATYADTRFPGMLRSYQSSDSMGSEVYFKGQIIVLVNELTQSFSEYITMLLQANPKTITVGRSSSGADGNVSILGFPGGIKTMYTGIGIYYPGMIATQRTGVKIDHIVEPTIKSLQDDADIILEKALVIAKQNGPGRQMGSCSFQCKDADP